MGASPKPPQKPSYAIFNERNALSATFPASNGPADGAAVSARFIMIRAQLSATSERLSRQNSSILSSTWIIPAMSFFGVFGI